MGDESRFERLINEALAQQYETEQRVLQEAEHQDQKEENQALALQAKELRDRMHDGTAPEAVFTSEDVALCQEFLQAMEQLQYYEATPLTEEKTIEHTVERKRWLLPPVHVTLTESVQEVVTYGYPIGYSRARTKAKNGESIAPDIYLCVDGLLR